MGRIGQEVAQRLRGWGSTVIYHDPVRLTPDRERDLDAAFAPLDDLLSRADVVTVHVPLSAATRHLIDARALSLMKPTAVLVNTSRGGPGGRGGPGRRRSTQGRIGGAGLDVLSAEPPPADHPLLSLAEHRPHPPHRGSHLAELAPALQQLLRQHRPVSSGERPQWVVPELADLIR